MNANSPNARQKDNVESVGPGTMLLLVYILRDWSDQFCSLIRDNSAGLELLSCRQIVACFSGEFYRVSIELFFQRIIRLNLYDMKYTSNIIYSS